MSNDNLILFYDGYCGLCNGSVNFILDKDKKATMKFAPLQSDVAQEILSDFPETKDLDSLMLYDKDLKKVFYKSKAVLKIAKYLGGVYSLAGIFWIIPNFIRDAIYDFVAKNRYKWFGKYDTCRMPQGNVKERMLGEN